MSDVIEAYQTEELELLREQIRRFMRDYVKPIEDKLPYNATGCGGEDRALLKAKAEELGLTRLSVPAEFGGNLVSALTRRGDCGRISKVSTRCVRASSGCVWRRSPRT